eukprot:gnl/Chilomastix_cuspidata/10869.p1 GENE.gnl/Chilomastix_cuspidata/10869~~gnl/Chilomastix_cuspidata/10869.p1  ORF type:complete len:137 (-),score=0.73 gnl/Chilomastix_cuspidata/10869:213-623(-)
MYLTGLIAKKKNIYRLILIFIGALLISSCGRKGMPVAPDEAPLKKPYNISLKQDGRDIELFWNYDGDADFFKIDLAFIDCEACPANFRNIGEVSGDENYFVFTVNDFGKYKVKLRAFRKIRVSEPQLKEFSVLNEK